jgi:hypothetical protein
LGSRALESGQDWKSAFATNGSYQVTLGIDLVLAILEPPFPSTFLRTQ